MSLRLKLILPPLISVLMIFAVIQWYWEPQALEREKIKFEQHTQELLKLSETVIIDSLTEKDYGTLFSLLEAFETFYQGRWECLILYDAKGKKIYPILKAQKSQQLDIDLLPLRYPLMMNNTHVGHLEISVNWGEERKEIMSDLDYVRNLLMLLVVFSALFNGIFQLFNVYRPLQQLESAIKNIQEGRLDSDLPSFSNDEIGSLVQSFKSMQRELHFQREALDQHAIVSLCDAKGKIIYVNQRFIDRSGYSKSELLGQTHQLIKSNIHSADFYQGFWKTIASGKSWQGNMCNKSRSGDLYWLNTTVVPLVSEQGKVERYLSIRTDITKEKEVEASLQHMANYDALTDLPTRRLAFEKLKLAIANARRYKTQVALLFLDLDGFKLINDQHGHEVGDGLLVQLGQRLKKTVREVDTVARFGGDEFVVILTQVTQRKDVSRVAQSLIDNTNAPFEVLGIQCHVGVSIGIASYPQNATDPDELIRKADDLMYEVKRQGKNNFCYCEEENPPQSS